VHSCGQKNLRGTTSEWRRPFVSASAQLDRRRAPAERGTTGAMAIVASEPTPGMHRRPTGSVSHFKTRPALTLVDASPKPASASNVLATDFTNADNLRAVTGVLEGVGAVSSTSNVIENELPLSGCRLRVTHLPDGSRIGQLVGPSGQWLDEARCERTSQVSGWFGRTVSGATWALAFGAGGAQESLEVRFASLRARRVVPVVSDHYGLWVAEVVGNFRAATILASTRVTTFRLHFAS
jgi:hypothetical protein